MAICDELDEQALGLVQLELTLCDYLSCDIKQFGGFDVYKTVPYSCPTSCKNIMG